MEERVGHNVLMISRLLTPTFLLCCAVLPAPFARSADYAEDVKPILAAHCFKCHGEKTQKGDLRLDQFTGDLRADRREAERWHDVRNAVVSGEMPPPEEKPLSDVDRRHLTAWIDHAIESFVEAERSTEGRVVLRRLNRVEYQNTMRDLLGIDTDYVQNLPPEGLSEDGFRNNGQTLQMSDLQLEYYLDAARLGLGKAIVTGGQPHVVHQTFSESINDKNRGSKLLDDDQQFIARLMEYPNEGEILIRVKARARLVEGRGYPRLRAAVGYRADVQAPRRFMDPIDVTSDQWQTFEFRDRIEHFPLPSKTQSKFPGLLVWLDNAYAEGANKPLKPKRPLKKKRRKKNNRKNDGNDGAEEAEQQSAAPANYPLIEIDSVEFVGPVFDAWPPEHHTAILPKRGSLSEDVYVREHVLQPFASRAFRRPVALEELEPYRQFFVRVRPTASSLEDAIRETLAMVLISPDFLYLFEPAKKKRKLTDHELAARLSYLIWSTMPDRELLADADSNQLNRPELLTAHVDRMLSDPRSQNFVEQFAGQWLDVDAIDRVAINPEFYPDFDNALKPSMRNETIAFFAEVLRKKQSALNFLDSDFVMLNEPLANHYGIFGPRGSTFERVQLKDDERRGGVLTQASVLLGNSTGEDSHPVKRAVWILQRLLDDPPADPPPNVPSLDTTDPDFADLPVREQLRVHRNDSGCRDCHRGIDPWGIALENFGADGLWRDDIPRKSPNRKRMRSQGVISETTLPDGSKISGLADLKAHLLEHRREQFARAFTSRLLAYALGRSLELGDEPTVNELTREFVSNDFQIDKLLRQIVLSEPFQTK